MSMKKVYRIAEVYLEIEGDESCFCDTMCEFETEAPADAEKVRIVLAAGEVTVPAQEELLHTEEMTIYGTEEEYLMQYHRSGVIAGCRIQKQDECAVIYIKQTVGNDEEISGAIRNIFFYYLQKRGKMVVHSASILYKGKVWLFSAPSGTGKTSHVSFWKECGYPVEDFNGDMAICYTDESGQAVAAGLPWCGTSGIYRNMIAPLGGVIFLKRGNNNSVRKPNVFEGIMQLTARSLTPNWDEACVKRNVQLAEELAEKISIGELLCTYEKTAAEVSKQFIDGV